MYEQQLITKYFLNITTQRPDVVVGIGDDAAILNIPNHQQLVVTIDTLNAGIHFPYPATSVNTTCHINSAKNITSAYDIGYKTAAVNLSDLAAMGAAPAWMTLALSLPEINPRWLEQFSAGFFVLLNQFNVVLVGGDLNRGPLSITAQAHGLVAKGKAILRSTAQAGDLIYVSGQLGGAAYALQLLQNETETTILSQVLPALNRPTPRIELGLALSNLASAALDLSDGLSTDLPRLLRASQVGAEIDLAKLPIAKILTDNLSRADYQRLAFAGGDDYELCFTVPPEQQATVAQLSQQLNLALTPIGEITDGSELILLNATENYATLQDAGYTHFKG